MQHRVSLPTEQRPATDYERRPTRVASVHPASCNIFAARCIRRACEQSVDTWRQALRSRLVATKPMAFIPAGVVRPSYPDLPCLTLTCTSTLGHSKNTSSVRAPSCSATKTSCTNAVNSSTTSSSGPSAPAQTHPPPHLSHRKPRA